MISVHIIILSVIFAKYKEVIYYCGVLVLYTEQLQVYTSGLNMRYVDKFRKHKFHEHFHDVLVNLIVLWFLSKPKNIMTVLDLVCKKHMLPLLQIKASITSF